jgi:hypothetical protein
MGSSNHPTTKGMSDLRECLDLGKREKDFAIKPSKDWKKSKAGAKSMTRGKHLS